MRTLKSIVVLALVAGLAVGGADVARADPPDDPVDQALQAIEDVRVGTQVLAVQAKAAAS